MFYSRCGLCFTKFDQTNGSICNKCDLKFKSLYNISEINANKNECSVCCVPNQYWELRQEIYLTRDIILCQSCFNLNKDNLKFSLFKNKGLEIKSSLFNNKFSSISLDLLEQWQALNRAEYFIERLGDSTFNISEPDFQGRRTVTTATRTLYVYGRDEFKQIYFILEEYIDPRRPTEIFVEAEFDVLNNEFTGNVW